ncbi:MAG: outer membrane protein assembly factor BamA [Bacteroidales bacterium]|nr:outer membrane protein assembly factor BamA [Bacteroidales bacterium]MBR4980891.1 outer membrane protein assembly factor BamA [Bacteroidales bacterium]MBR5907156.1 outer membrane protein assembly factor BamA [Bacteroidales bacterium]
MKFLRSVILLILALAPLSLRAQDVNYITPKTYVLGGIKVTGVKYLSEEQLISVTGLNVGDKVTIPSIELSDILKRVWAQRYFSDAGFYIDSLSQNKDTVWLGLRLTERPRVSRWIFNGIRSGQRSDLDQRLKLKRGTELSDYVIASSTDIIKRYFHEKGFLKCEVKVSQQEDPVISNAVRVTFDIDKGPRVKIAKITFDGNKNLSDWTIMKSMKHTRDKRLLNMFKSKRYKEKEFKEDKTNLINKFNEMGYRDARILKDTMYYIEPDRLQIDFKLEEGDRYYFRDITWTGNSIYSTDQLNSVLRIKKGDVYDLVTMDKRLNGDPKQMDPDVKKMYTDNGYLFFNILPVEKKIEKDSVDVEMRIYEGKPATFNKVIINGNNITAEKIARRALFTKPGYLFSQSDFERSVRELSSIGHFNPEVFQTGAGYSLVPDANKNTVDIAYNLEEKPNSQVELSGGWGGNTFVGTLGLSFNNFAIKRVFKPGAWRPVPLGDGQTFAIKFQTSGTYYTALSASFSEPWLMGNKPVSLSISTYYTRQTNSTYFYKHSDQYMEVFGFNAGLGSRLNWPDNYFILFHSLSWQTYKLKNWYYNFLFDTGLSHNLSYTITLNRNSTDQQIYPRRGSDFLFSLQLTPPYSLLRKGHRDYKNMSSEDKYNWIEYHKWQFKSDVYLTLVQNLVFRAAANFGYIGYYKKSLGYSPFEGFELGGDGMSGYNTYGSDIIALRGYPNYSLTPTENGAYVGHIYDKFTLELRYPLILQPSSTIYALAFLEGGNCWKDLSDFNPFEIKRSAGVGVRIMLPVVGMMGVDWGYGFDPVPNEGKKRGGSQFHFMIGQQF